MVLRSQRFWTLTGKKSPALAVCPNAPRDLGSIGLRHFERRSFIALSYYALEILFSRLFPEA